LPATVTGTEGGLDAGRAQELHQLAADTGVVVHALGSSAPAYLGRHRLAVDREKRGATIETSGDATPTIGSPALLLQMTTNLLHNAIVHNPPEQGTVWVTTSVHPKSVVLTVENTGEVPGLGPGRSSVASDLVRDRAVSNRWLTANASASAPLRESS
jgi:signal transduction histidine kinase